MRRVAFLVLLSCAIAHAHGGPENSQSMAIRRGHDADVLVATTFGSVHTHDGGATWEWMCEQPFDYVYGFFQPQFLYSAGGEEMATGFDHVVATRDGCTVRTVGADEISAMAFGPDGALYLTSVGADDAHIYRSTDDGATLPVAATAGQIGDWYTSIIVAPSDPTRVYAASYRILDLGKRAWQVYASRDAGTTFAPVALPPGTDPGDPDGIDSGAMLDVVAVDRAAPDTVFLRIDNVDGVLGSELWRSDDAGGTWTRVLAATAPLHVILRANGDLVASIAPDPVPPTPQAPAGVDLPPHAWVSHDRGDHWIDLATTLHLGCFAETSTGELWACTREQSPLSSDGAAVMRTTDLVTWTPVLKFADILAPLACPAGTTQADVCEVSMNWCPLVTKLGITSPQILCDPQIDPMPMPSVDPPGGCCDAGGSPGSLALAGLIAALLARRRR